MPPANDTTLMDSPCGILLSVVLNKQLLMDVIGRPESHRLTQVHINTKPFTDYWTCRVQCSAYILFDGTATAKKVMFHAV